MEEVTFEASIDERKLKVVLNVSKEKRFGKQAKIHLEYGAKILHAWGIDAFLVLETQEISLSNLTEVYFSQDLSRDVYFGEKVHLIYRIKLDVVDTVLFFDSHIFFELPREILPDGMVYISASANASQPAWLKALLQSGTDDDTPEFRANTFKPKDDFNLSYIFAAMSQVGKMLVVGFGLLGLGAIGLFFVGWGWLGIFCLIIAIIAEFIVWNAFGKPPVDLKISWDFQPWMPYSECLSGVVSSPLQELTIEVSQAYRETGMYRTQGKNSHNTTFTIVSPSQVLMSQAISYIQAGEDLKNYVSGTLDENFSKWLMSPIKLFTNYHIEPVLLVRLMHPQLFDKEVVQEIKI